LYFSVSRATLRLELARVLHVQQPSIAKLECQSDMYLSTQLSYIEVAGGEPEVIAVIPDESLKSRKVAAWRESVRSLDFELRLF
jgi:hypothetical protein